MRNIFKWFSPLDHFLTIVGISSAIILGLSVPSAVFLVGTVVTLFIKNRRARLSVLLNEGKEHTDYEQETDTFIHQLAHEFEESVEVSKNVNETFNVITHGNHTLQQELDLNFKLNDQFEASLHHLCFIMLMVSLCQLISGFLTCVTFDVVCGRVGARLRNLLNCTSRFEDENVRNCNKSISEDIRLTESGLNNNFALLGSAVVTLISCVAMSFYVRWQLALISLPHLILNLCASKITLKLRASTVKKLKCEFANVSNYLAETVRATPTVVAFEQEKAETLRYESQLNNLVKYVKQTAIISGLFNGMVIMSTHLINGVLLWYGVRLVMQDFRNSKSFTPGSIVMVFFSFLRGLTTFTQAIPHLPVFQDSLKAVNRLEDAMQFCLNKDESVLISTPKMEKRWSSLVKKIGLLKDKTAIQRLALHSSSSQTDIIIQQYQRGLIIFNFLHLYWPYLFLGCLGSVLLGGSTPATFYIFCEVIGSMANLEDKIVFERTNHMLGAFCVLAIITFIATFLQHYMLQTLGFLLSNKLRASLLKAYFTNYITTMSNSNKGENLELLLNKNISSVETAVISGLGTGVQIVSAAIIALPLASSVVWAQAFVLSYIFPVLFIIYFLKQMTERKQERVFAFGQNFSDILVNSLLCGFIRAFREMAFATILFFGAYLIIHHGENNKNVLQVNLIMINTALLISQLNVVGVNVKKGWKAVKSLERFLSQPNVHFLGKSQSIIPGLPIVVTSIDTHLGKTNLIHPGQKMVIEVEDKKTFFLALLARKSQETLLINDWNICDIDHKWLHKNVTVISEEIQFLFPSRSLYENVCYGNESKEKTFEVVEELAEFQDWDVQLSTLSPKLISSYHKSLLISRCLSRKSPIIITDENFVNESMKQEENQILIIIKQN